MSEDIPITRIYMKKEELVKLHTDLGLLEQEIRSRKGLNSYMVVTNEPDIEAVRKVMVLIEKMV